MQLNSLSLHDALPIWLSRHNLVDVQVQDGAYYGYDVPRGRASLGTPGAFGLELGWPDDQRRVARDRKSTRLNSSHANISYAVFCLKKKKIHKTLLRDS